MKQLLVSMIVPVYNQAEYVKRCLNSINTQTYPYIEILCVDDGSTDLSPQILDDYAVKDNRIKVIHQENRGVVSARKTGIECSSGEYIMFVDADDWVEPDMVETLVNEIGDADIISSGIFWEKYPGREKVVTDNYREGLYHTPEEKKEFFSKMIFDLEGHEARAFTPGLWNKLYKRELVNKVYRLMDHTITYAEDSVFLYMCVFKAESFVIIHKPLYHYCYNEMSVCHREHMNILEDINKVYVSLLDECGRYDKDTRLVEQLQSWIVMMTRYALNERMRFDSERIHLSEFLVNTRVLKPETKKIVLYGAGQAGKDFRHQLKKLGYEIVLWVDGNYCYWNGLGLDVKAPEQILEVEYDEILIAVWDEKAAKSIEKHLTELGVRGENVVWSRPIVL